MRLWKVGTKDQTQGEEIYYKVTLSDGKGCFYSSKQIRFFLLDRYGLSSGGAVRANTPITIINGPLLLVLAADNEESEGNGDPLDPNYCLKTAAARE